MGIEFRLGRNDHKVTEDFLATGSRVVDGITIEAHNVSRQAGVIEAAHDLGVPVNIDLMLDRLQNPGFDFGALPYVPEDLEQLVISLSSNAMARRDLVDRAIDFQVGLGAAITSPHIHSGNALEDELVVLMASHTVSMASGSPVRAIVAGNRDRLAANDLAAARLLADGLASVGVSSVELRLSPTGDKDMSVAKIRSMLSIVNVFATGIPDVRLGFQGIIGPAALALGEVSGFSTGIGLREQYNYTTLRKPHDPSEDDHAFGPQAGVRLPTADVTIPRRFATALYADPGIRSRLRCTHSCCVGNIDGPARDPRTHYLRSRAEQLTSTLDRPTPWRPRMEHQRLERAIDTIEMINNGHIPAKCHPIKTRTMRSLATILDEAASSSDSERASA